MAKKKKKVFRPFCWYCDRDFEDEGVLIQHQKQKHFKCDHCGKRLNTAGGMAIHVAQVHKETIKRVPNAIPGRDSLDIDIQGMVGIPEADLAAYMAKYESHAADATHARNAANAWDAAGPATANGCWDASNPATAPRYASNASAPGMPPLPPGMPPMPPPPGFVAPPFPPTSGPTAFPPPPPPTALPPPPPRPPTPSQASQQGPAAPSPKALPGLPPKPLVGPNAQPRSTPPNSMPPSPKKRTFDDMNASTASTATTSPDARVSAPAVAAPATGTSSLPARAQEVSAVPAVPAAIVGAPAAVVTTVGDKQVVVVYSDDQYSMEERRAMHYLTTKG
ncbi:hypothetical protein BCR44DRAFT_1498416 [Catenaria anguillulae PL171]|uniref:C2H2-type domain-containing protein n=1 Tax=Catenaria anguillulae PL171 TaxID=765915 RepID=A0A1Y2HR59_9FUNG|nr:hypothetical protein BCR44DRAFT_1498416 [Catenaria anguillulae PL171]